MNYLWITKCKCLDKETWRLLTQRELAIKLKVVDIEVSEAGLRVPEHPEHLLLPVRLLPEADQGPGVEPGHRCSVT